MGFITYAENTLEAIVRFEKVDTQCLKCYEGYFQAVSAYLDESIIPTSEDN